MFTVILLFTAVCLKISAQEIKNNDGKYDYLTCKNDPLNARIYKLANGLTVYMSVNKDVPRIQTRIPVRAGSKNDPSDATGLAHYLEHMLFKGTSKYGTADYKSEKVQIDNIISLFDVYRKTTDEGERKALYRQIDSISQIASGYAIANEYDKMLSLIGATGTNAYTSNEQTVYTNDIPSNQIQRWLTIEAERFREPVMRLFHTELEVVYEEKNRSLDNGSSKAYENLFAGLFKNHPYGTQTTIGTVEHLKNPSIQKVIDYYNTYYVPNNMAICLSGDLNPEETIKLIDKLFGGLPSKIVPEFVPPSEEPIMSPVIKEVFGPESESILMGYRFGGVNSKDAKMIEMIDYILSNGTAGLIDLNLIQSQKVLSASASANVMKDYSAHFLSASPREGQSLDEVKDLLLSQIELIKKGQFPDGYLKAAINNMKSSKIKAYENNASRVREFTEAFILGIPWDRQIGKINELAGISKEDIIKFANDNYKDNYVLVYKRTGKDNSVIKVTKPQITPVNVNRGAQSDFFKYISDIPAVSTLPVFIDYKKDLLITKAKDNITVYYKQNLENELFELSYIFDFGVNSDRELNLAVSYLPYLGTSKLSPSEVKQGFFNIGCNFNVNVTETQIVVSLTGLSEFFEKGVNLLESVLSDAQPNEDALKNLINDVLKKRANAKLNKNVILRQAMMNYGKYGSESPFTNIIPEQDLKTVNAGALTSKIKSLLNFTHEIVYYGKTNADELIKSINILHKSSPVPMVPPKAKVFTEQGITGNNVYVVNYEMKQAEIMFLSKGEMYNSSNVPVITLYNDYFGSGMSSLVFQELRESKALAYSVNSSYSTPQDKDKSHYINAYIGTQSDKLSEAMNGLFDLINNMPLNEIQFNSAKKGVLEQIQTQRINRSAVILNYLNAKKLGLDHDVRKDTYEKAQKMTLSDISDFQKSYIKDKNYNILVLGDTKKLDFSILEKFGKVKILSLEEIFGY